MIDKFTTDIKRTKTPFSFVTWCITFYILLFRLPTVVVEARGMAFPRQKRKGNAVHPRSPTIWPRIRSFARSLCDSWASCQ